MRVELSVPGLCIPAGRPKSLSLLSVCSPGSAAKPTPPLAPQSHIACTSLDTFFSSYPWSALAPRRATPTHSDAHRTSGFPGPSLPHIFKTAWPPLPPTLPSRKHPTGFRAYMPIPHIETRMPYPYFLLRF